MWHVSPHWWNCFPPASFNLTLSLLTLFLPWLCKTTFLFLFFCKHLPYVGFWPLDSFPSLFFFSCSIFFLDSLILFQSFNYKIGACILAQFWASLFTYNGTWHLNLIVPATPKAKLELPISVMKLNLYSTSSSFPDSWELVWLHGKSASQGTQKVGIQIPDILVVWTWDHPPTLSLE